ncbi:MAG: hypothetical protein JW893_00520 [Candidatus Omnitrophica bacterium]|nr:hypothetical protein [Candidatus Omnitrophota bacterium]
MKNCITVVLISTMILGLAGCGYTQKTVLPQDFKTIHVDTVINDINIGNIVAYETGLEIRITNAIIDHLQKDGQLRVVPREEADAILESKLVQFDQQGLRFNSLERVEEYRMVIVLDLVLRNAKTGDIIWAEPFLSGDSEYYVSTVRSIARSDAAERAIERLAENVTNRIVEDW